MMNVSIQTFKVTDAINLEEVGSLKFFNTVYQALLQQCKMIIN